jgi:D-alanine-D-alanine ligase
LKVAVLKGGRSLERQVSLRSGARVEDALASLGHRVVPVDVGSELVGELREAAPEVAFLALHGRGGEDGSVQELLEILGIPYTGPGVAACMRCLDKVLAKHELRAAGIPTPDWVAFNSTAFRELGAADALEEIEERLGFPLVVKPAAQGSALGVGFAADRDAVPEALIAAFSYDERVLLERHVEGRELAVGVLDGEPMPPVEVRPRQEDRYDYEARYEIGRTDFVCPADLSSDDAATVREVAVRTWETLGCEGFARVDLLLGAAESTGGAGLAGPHVIEAEAIPGLTDTSLYPMAAEAAGIEFEELCGRVLELALRRSPSAGAVA